MVLKFAKLKKEREKTPDLPEIKLPQKVLESYSKAAESSPESVIPPIPVARKTVPNPAKSSAKRHWRFIKGPSERD